jgi:hypothetical protein
LVQQSHGRHDLDPATQRAAHMMSGLPHHWIPAAPRTTIPCAAANFPRLQRR